MRRASIRVSSSSLIMEFSPSCLLSDVVEAGQIPPDSPSGVLHRQTLRNRYVSALGVFRFILPVIHGAGPFEMTLLTSSIILSRLKKISKISNLFCVRLCICVAVPVHQRKFRPRRGYFDNYMLFFFHGSHMGFPCDQVTNNLYFIQASSCLRRLYIYCKTPLNVFKILTSRKALT